MLFYQVNIRNKNLADHDKNLLPLFFFIYNNLLLFILDGVHLRSLMEFTKK